MKKLLFLALCSFGFAVEVDNIYEEAQALENQGKYKEAMILYKKVANLKVSKEDKYVNDLNEKQNSEFESFTTLKRDFYQKEIDKTEDKSTNENIKQIVTKEFDIHPYKKNYLLPATYTFNNIEDRENIETTFQVSFEKPIYHNLFGFDETISAAYTQKSFWQVAKSSAPFRESNYEPELFVQIPYDKESSLKAYKISAMHSSNGKDEEDSRSLNRIYLEGYFQFSELFIIPKVWYRIPEGKNDDNPDIEDYYGYGDLTLLYAYKKHTFELLVRNNLKFDDSNKGAVEFNWMFPLPEFLSTKNSYGMLQIFSGYGNSLIDYNKEINNVGLGIAFSR